MINPVESFALLDALAGIKARLFRRIPNLEVSVERREAMLLLAPYQRKLMVREELGNYPLVTAEQVHGDQIAVVSEVHNDQPLQGMDGLFTNQRGITLGIFVADCAPVWIVAKDGSAGALIHSGKKGTELGIVRNGISLICSETGLTALDLLVLIGPCIRPPCYEVDFAAMIRHQAEMAGVQVIHDTLICTACHPDRYYSYRREQGHTGRMLATLTLLPK